MLAEGGDGDERTGSRSRPIRRFWEIQEIVAAGILVAVAILAISGLASGIAATGINTGSLSGESAGTQSWATFLLYSTRWTGVVAMLLLLAAIGLVWWQVDGWADRLAELEDAEGEGEAGDEDEIVQAVVHIARNRAVATWTGVLLIVSSIAAVASLVGVVLQYNPGPNALAWSQFLFTGGGVLASLVLAAIGGFALVRLRRTTHRTLGVVDEAVDVS